HCDGERLIVLGAKDTQGSERSFPGVAAEQFTDQAIFQQLIHENVEPDLLVQYQPFRWEGKMLGILRICPNPVSRPYLMKKRYWTCPKMADSPDEKIVFSRRRFTCG
ncbi:MAG: hypothetical protein GX630_09690, partial [Actinobacteria bacterium]|nr:hypothetical protein [Actinomycetota bacterium]